MTSLLSANVYFLKVPSLFNISTLGTKLLTQKPLGTSILQAGFQPCGSLCWDKVLFDTVLGAGRMPVCVCVRGRRGDF